MIKFTKSDIEKQLVFADDNDEFYFFEVADTKEKRSLAQNAGLHHGISVLCKHTGDDVDDLKQRILVKLFGTSVKRIGGQEVIVQNKIGTSKLTKEECGEYIDAINAMGNFLGLGTLIESRQILSDKTNYDKSLKTKSMN